MWSAGTILRAPKLDDLLGRGGDHVEIEFISVQAIQELGEQADVGFEADALAGLDQVFTSDARYSGS